MNPKFSEGDAVEADILDENGLPLGGHIDGFVEYFDDPDVSIKEAGSEESHIVHKDQVRLLG